VEQLHINQDDEVDFFKFSSSAFLFAKKADVASLLSNLPQNAKIKLSPEELAVLKKLDTVRYPNRTEEEIAKYLNDDDRKALDKLIKRKLVVLYNDEKRKEKLYSISKYVYDNFLLRNKPKETSKPEPPPERAWGVAEQPRMPSSTDNKDVQTLESKGFVVLATEPEAAALSLAIGESIRQGQVIGLRSFNSKYYILLKSFYDAQSPKVVGALKNGPRSVDEISKETSLDPEAVRGILYVLAEKGEVTENRRDIFAIVQ